MISGLSKERALLTQHIWTYQNRRKEYKIKYGATSQTYKKLSKGITLAVWNMNRKVRRIDIQANKLKELKAKITEFIGISPDDRNGGAQFQLARKLYYRYGLEEGIGGRYLRVYIGDTNSRKPGQLRLKFIRSFQKKPENREMWYRFKEFMKKPPNH